MLHQPVTRRNTCYTSPIIFVFFFSRTSRNHPEGDCLIVWIIFHILSFLYYFLCTIYFSYLIS